MNKILLLVTMLVLSLQVSANPQKITPDTFESKMIKSVMYDAYTQYSANKSTEFFLNDTQKTESFIESLSKDKYHGAIKFENDTYYKYVIEKNFIYWESRNKNGKINITEFFNRNITVNSSVKCGGVCVWIGIIIAANCSANTALCNQRCNNCRNGALVCHSSCFTNSCEVQCNPMPANGFPLYDPWSYFDNGIELGDLSTLDP